MPATQRLRFVETFEAPPATVCAAMIGPQSYREWTSAFCEGSFFEGSWGEGQRIRFLSPSGCGIVAEIAENRPNEFISVRHLGVVANGADDTDSEAVRTWAPAYENYRFEALPDGGTRADRRAGGHARIRGLHARDLAEGAGTPEGDHAAQRCARPRGEHPMKIDNALAGLAVADFAASSAWYERLFGRPADSTPMPNVAEWKFPRGGWLQLFEDAGRAGKGSVTLAIGDRDAVAAHLQQLGIVVAQMTSSTQVKTLSVDDPDGNAIVFAQALDAGMAR